MKRHKLSRPRSRAELIAAWKFGITQADRDKGASLAAPPPPPVKAPASQNGTESEPAKPAADGTESDQTVTEAIAALKTAAEKALAAQQADPDADDPNDKKVLAGLEQLVKDVDQLTTDQAADASTEPKPALAPAPTTAAGPPPQASPPEKANPVDESGNVDAGAKCANPDCQHLATSHVDTPDGANTGGCSMANCQCQAFQVEAQPNTGKGDASGPDTGAQGAEPSSGSQELANAPVNAVPDGPPLPPGPAAPAAGDANLNQPPPVEGSENMGPAFTIPVGVIENQATTDGRRIGPEALTWRAPPLPLMGLATETHDPEGFDQNDPAVLCGRIDSLERMPGEGDTTVICAKGFYLPNEDGLYYAGLTEAMGRCGISADVATLATEIEIGQVDADGWPMDMAEILTAGEILGFTQVPFPAFAGAYIVLGDGQDSPDAKPIPQQSEGPAVPDKPPAAVTAGGQLVHLMAYEACEPCQQGLELIASAAPAAPPKAWFEDPGFTEDDGRLVEILDRRGQRSIGGKYACPLTVTDDGRVYGHLAPWGVCHIGKPGCVTAPKSQTGYAYFRRGQHVVTAEGEKVRVGTITVDAGHADVRSDPTSAMAHYDNIATAVADVNVGEDEYGIWVAGAIRPTATTEQVAALRASSISGDWRGLGGSLELVAALAVPVPGFPHAVVAAGEEEALVAAGSTVMHRLKHPVQPEEASPEQLLRLAAPALGRLARQDARDRLAALR